MYLLSSELCTPYIISFPAEHKCIRRQTFQNQKMLINFNNLLRKTFLTEILYLSEVPVVGIKFIIPSCKEFNI